MDRDVGRVLDRVRELGLAENTIVFFTSDNGPHREGGHDSDFFDSNGPLRGIKRDLYEGGIRVPMIAWGPGRVPAGATTDHVAYLGDFMATVADLTGREAPRELDSVSMLPTLLGEPGRQRQHEYLYWEFYEGGSSQAVRMGRWKGVRKPMLTGQIELYDLEADLSEQNDVASRHPEVVARIRAAMAEAHERSADWPVPAARN
jgi:arylsulfatase A-like enzyme